MGSRICSLNGYSQKVAGVINDMSFRPGEHAAGTPGEIGSAYHWPCISLLNENCRMAGQGKVRAG